MSKNTEIAEVSIDSRALAERLRSSRATAAEDQHYTKVQAAAREARRQREPIAEKKAEEIIADLLTKLDAPGRKPGEELEVMRIDGQPETATVVFNRLMEAARSNGGAPCWYPVRRDTYGDICGNHYGVIKLRYGNCPAETARDR